MSEELIFAVCDDDGIVCDAVAQRVCGYLSERGVCYLDDKFNNSKELLSTISNGKRKYDVVFLDIEMPELDGLELAKALRELDKSPDIIFVSNREDRVFDTFAVKPFGFVRKNHYARDLDEVLASYVSERMNARELIAFQTENNSVTRKIRATDIVYVESFRYTQMLHLVSGEAVEIHSTMKELEERLERYDIVRVIKGYAVNFKYVRAFSRSGIVLDYDGGITISVSREKLNDIKSLYMKYLRRVGVALVE